jgi:hypothetical protein
MTLPCPGGRLFERVCFEQEVGGSGAGVSLSGACLCGLESWLSANISPLLSH